MKPINSIFTIAFTLAGLFMPNGEALECYKCKYLETEAPPQYQQDTTFTTDPTCQENTIPSDSLLETCSLSTSTKNITQNTTISFQEDLTVNRCLKVTVNGRWGEYDGWSGKVFRATYRTCAVFPETNKPTLGCIMGKIKDMSVLIRPWIHFVDDYYFAELLIDDLDGESDVDICSCQGDKCNSAARSASAFAMIIIIAIFPSLF